MLIATIIGVTLCVAALVGFVWLLNFVLSPDDDGFDDSDWYSDDEGL